MVPQRAAPHVADVRVPGLVRMVLCLRKPCADPRASFEVGVERVECVGADLACLDLTQDRPDHPVDVAPVGGEGRFSEVCDLEVLVEDLAEEDLPGGGLMAVRLLEQPRERRGRLGLVRARLLEDPFLAGHRVFAGVDPHPERTARQPLDVAPAGRGYGGRIVRGRLASPRTSPRGASHAFEN